MHIVLQFPCTEIAERGRETLSVCPAGCYARNWSDHCMVGGQLHNQLQLDDSTAHDRGSDEAH